MRLRSFLLVFILTLSVISCSKKNDNGISEPPEGSIRISELETEHDYYLPFAILNDTNIIGSAILNDEPVKFGYGDFIEFKESGFYELILKYKDSRQPNDTFLFTTTTEERAFSEWGIKAWIPVKYETTPLGSEEIEVFYPRRYTDSINVPFIFYIKDSGVRKPVYCTGDCTASGNSFSLKRGVGSVEIPSSSVSDQTNFRIGGRSLDLAISKIPEAPVFIHGTIDQSVEIPANALVKITGDINLAASASLTVGPGALILVSEGVDINLSGSLVLSGTEENPILVTCSQKGKYWGGFITRTSGGAVDASYTIFCHSGYHDSEEYAWGHAGRQALFYTENSTLKLDHCYITDHIGQVFYLQNSVLTFDNILVQRAKTGGQINYSDLTLRNSVFTDFPDDSYIFRDEDNDALYLNATDATINNTTFMFAKDDGLDSGAGEGGEVTINECWFEACFHEGAALSSIEPAVKTHRITGSVFTNCGQGLELGYSSPNHSVVADNCQFLANHIGIRYGDNYDWSEVNGKMSIKNSLSLKNDKDVWNMIRMIWSPKLENLSFENTMVSKFCSQYPQLEVQGNNNR